MPSRFDTCVPDKHVAITPSDSTTYTNPTLRAVVVGGAGSLILTIGNAAVTYTVVAGQRVEGLITKVGASSTATGLVGQY